MSIGDSLKHRPRYQVVTDSEVNNDLLSDGRTKELPTLPISYKKGFNDEGCTAYPQNPGLAFSIQPDTVYDKNQDLIVSLLLTFVSLITRLYKIGWRPNVSWDEAHFGKFGAYYINHTFYHDVHPPLAKMLVALSEVIAGHNGTFKFDSGSQYPKYVNYTLMRIQMSLYGVALVPLAYLTCLQLRMSRKMALLAALFVLFDNAICVMSRFILLDQPLLCFTAMTLYGIAGFNNRRKEPFSRTWWKWLLFTGFSLGLVFSSKWIGFFSILLVGISTIEDLWHMLADWKMPIENYLKHWAYRMIGLILVPLSIYAICFRIHFAVLYKSGTGDGRMSSAFQARLQGNDLNTQPNDVAYGSLVTLRSHYPGAGFLHSHPHKYPEGSKQQQITCYSYKDTNNKFYVRKEHGSKFDYLGEMPQILQDGDIIRLVHNESNFNVHLNLNPAPLTVRNFEVSCHNKDDEGDDLDHWKIELVSETGRRKHDGKIHALTTVFRLRNVRTKCLLMTNGRKLPEWGWKQAEVSCSKEDSFSPKVLWNIEQNWNKQLPSIDTSRVVYSNFWRDMIHLNIEMARTNNALVPDRDKYNVLESDPWSWPFLIYPMRLVGWGNDTIKYYEIGNPILWWMSAIVCLAYPFQFIWYALKHRRQASDFKRGEWYDWWDRSKLLWGGWALHYISFFLMGRVTYIHHYLPALYFALLLLAFEIDYYGRWIARGYYLNKIFYVFAITSGLVFYHFSPFTYGWKTPAKDMGNRGWLSTWNIDKDLYGM
ncbi:Protein O-mannosyltransferase 2 [Mycoemilia scoparia]|uniref:Dolichyl-phosphate-mannose--protein mannosyltransferase n=1 Tax=Mycoemilia scoparia TaxID=417184 RepID=A0A9W8DW24_9FUNG|nr:Protein O-mannosyltransferase 2 [Mycoemilia scoparia]